MHGAHHAPCDDSSNKQELTYLRPGVRWANSLWYFISCSNKP